MWKLRKVYATNIVSFRELEMNVNEDVATLIFGMNMDNENQRNNGSGKSSLIEAIAFGITGDTLRKVDTDEIINDAAEHASVQLIFENTFDRNCFTVERIIHRKGAQEISCDMYNPEGEKINVDRTVQPTVNDYNKYILEELGLTKDDIYSCFILCKNKYKSFLEASDRSKKELINRFSNGQLVDQSIEQLRKDMEPVYKDLLQKDGEVTKLVGKIEALDEQLQKAVADEQDAQASKEQKISQIEKDIEETRGNLRSLKETVKKANDRLDTIDAYGDELEKLEDSGKSLVDKYHVIHDKFIELGIPVISDYEEKCKEHQKKLNDAELQMPLVKKEILDAEKRVEAAESTLSKKKAEHEKLKAEYADESKDSKIRIEEIQLKIEKLDKTLDKTRTTIKEAQEDYNEVDKDLVRLRNLIQGKVTCPKCGHEFILSEEGKTLEDLRKEAQQCEKDKTSIQEEIDSLNKKYDDAEKKRSDNEQKVKDIKKGLSDKNDKVIELGNELRGLQETFNIENQKLDTLKSRMTALQNTVKLSSGFMVDLGKAMFDEAFNAIDSRMDTGEQFVKDKKAEITRKEALVEQHQESIKALRDSSTGDITESLKKSREDYEKQHGTAVIARDKVKTEYDKLQVQELYFSDFKSYLANQKIDAIAAITNDFLTKIGSDIRVELEGFKKLKSGKIRDKITVRILRNGVDCGSFEKFSGGEKARVCLANILAMWQLTNSSCADGKGLGLLIIDEVLDCSDESGIASYCEAINKFGITTLMVTQGLVAESYPYRLLVTKSNGISTIG